VKLWNTIKDVEYDVKTPGMSRIMSRHRDNTNNSLKIKAESKRHKLFVNQVRCNTTYVWGLPSQEGNSL